MPITPDEEPLARVLHPAIDAVRPRAGVEARVLESTRQRIEREASPPSPMRGWLGGALIALAVVAVLGGALGITLAQRKHVTPATTHPPAVTPLPRHLPTPPVVAPSPTPSAAGDFGSASFSFSNPSDGWTLGSACDVQNTCTFGIYRTTDGGQKWVHLAFPFSVDGGNFTLNVTAASSTDAWVWGSPSSGLSVLDATHDGGQSWQQMTVGSAEVGDVVVSDDRAWAVTTCATTVPCTARLFSQSITGGAWSVLALPASVQSPIDNNGTEPLAQLVREGGRMWVLDENQQRPALVRSDDDGHIWALLAPLPCHAGATMILGRRHPISSCSRAPMRERGRRRRRYGPRAMADRHGYFGVAEWYNEGFSPPEPNVGSINSGGAPIGLVMLSSTTAWMANDREDDLVTYNGGVTWTHAALPPDFFGGAGGAEGIGFTDSLHGWTFVPGGLWTTSDGGITWREQPGITTPAA